MSRIRVVLLIAAWLSMAPGLALGGEDQESRGRASAARIEEGASCMLGSEALPSGRPRYCPARSRAASGRTLETQEVPIYVPPNRGSPPTRIGGASRGGVRPASRI